MQDVWGLLDLLSSIDIIVSELPAASDAELRHAVAEAAGRLHKSVRIGAALPTGE